MGALCSVHPAGSGAESAADGTYVDFNIVGGADVGDAGDGGKVAMMQTNIKSRRERKLGKERVEMIGRSYPTSCVFGLSQN